VAFDRAFGDWAREHFAALGPLEIKTMFGAGALYADGLIWALLDDGTVWLKADAETEADLREAGSRQFTYPMKDGRLQAMAYWSLPDSAADDPDEAVVWARASIAAARRKAAAKPVRNRKR